jgi:hypothetical protein
LIGKFQIFLARVKPARRSALSALIGNRLT